MQIQNLKVQPEVLKSKASEINAEKSNILGIMDQVKVEMNSLVGLWESEASSEYQAKFKQTYNDMESILVILSEYVNDLKTAADIYTAAETKIKTVVGGLPVDGVFRG